MMSNVFASRAHGKRAAAWLSGTALAGLMAATPALAQNTNLETVVVTGSLIRGVAHTGSDLITLNQDSMRDVGATTVQQMLNSIPALTTFGTDGAFFSGGSQDATGSSSPVIHSIGAVVSDGTLVLIDGHRIAQTGSSQTVTDPGVVPSGAIARVEVLPDGASSLYGADAVAGVVNFITRKDFDGAQTSAKFGHADQYQTSDITQEFGHNWGSGGAILSYEFGSKSNLLASARPYTAANKLALGGPNLANFNCAPASISQTNASSGTASNVFLYPYSGATIGSAGNAAVAPCDSSGMNSIEPSETHNAVMVSLHQQINDRITISGDINFSSRMNNARQARGTLSATAFGPTGTGPALGAGQRNPFYVGNATTGTASEFIRIDFSPILGPGAHIKSGAQNFFADAQIDVDIGGGWVGSLAGTLATDTSFAHTYGTVCTACALLALNGTTSTSGAAATSALTSALPDYFVLNTIAAVTRVLTTANALDVWNPPASNHTSAQVMSELTASQLWREAVQTDDDVRVKFDGPLWALPAGEMRAAIGGQYDLVSDHQFRVDQNGTGPSVSSSRFVDVTMGRNVYSAYAELFIPLISPEMSIPLVQKLDLDLSGRYDQYSDFGTTKNPKIGFNWVVADGLTARTSYGTSFTAPHLNSIGQKGTGITTATNVAQTATAFQIPADHPSIPGSFCQTTPQVACNVTAAQPGINISSGNQNLRPQTGLTYSIGLDWDAGRLVPFLQGFRGSVTYWHVKYQDVIDQPQPPNLLTNPGLQQLLLIAPPGGWDLSAPAVQAVIGKLPVNGALPQTVWYINNMVMANAFNDLISGYDFDLKYGLNTAALGTFTLDATGSWKTQFDAQGGGKGSTSPFISFLNGLHNSSSQHVMALTGRASLNWAMDPWDVTFYWNYVNPYWNPITAPPFNTATFLPNGVTGPGGYQKVHAQNTFDLHINYTMPHDWLDGWSNGMTASLHISNILNTAPPLYFTNGGFGGTVASGYDNYNGNPIGRMMVVGLEKKW